jgi:DNA uptake protein ComE-like DNA-binding protein
MSGAARGAGGTEPLHPATVAIAAGLLALHAAGGWPVTRGTPTERSVAPPVLLRINPNLASVEELMLLPGIGPTLAANIVRYRESVPASRAFTRPGDLDFVPRIGPATVERLAPLLTFGAPEGDSGARERVAAGTPP